MTESEQKWIETNNQVCALLRQAHDVLACSSLPPRRRAWVGLTRDEQSFVYSSLHNATSREDSFWVDFANAIEKALKEKNNG
jgi:gluconate kinase